MTGRRSTRAAVPRTAASAAAAALLLASAGAFADEDDSAEPSVTPYRPTVSNPADLSAPGWLEGEFGGLRILGEDRSQVESAPFLLKYAFDENHGLLLGGDAYVSDRPAVAPRQSGVGDLALEWKQRVPIADKTAFGIEAGVVAPTARRGLGVGTAQWLVNGIFSTDAGALHIDVNLGEARGGDRPPNVSAWQTTWATAVSKSISDKWGAAFELSGTHQRGVAAQSQALFALSCNVSRRLSLDAGAAYGLPRAAHDRSLFAGATVLIGRLR